MRINIDTRPGGDGMIVETVHAMDHGGRVKTVHHTMEVVVLVIGGQIIEVDLTREDPLKRVLIQ